MARAIQAGLAVVLLVLTGVSCKDEEPGVAVPATSTSTSASQTVVPAGPEDLAERLAPLVFLAKGDKFGPTSAEDFLGNSELMFSNTPGCPDPLVADVVDPVKLTSGEYVEHEDLDGCSREGTRWSTNQPSRPRDREHVGFYLNLDDARYAGVGPAAPAYVQYKKHAYVVYWLLYARNDAPSGPLDRWDHEGDWERVAVLLDGSDSPTDVVYFGHEGKCRIAWPQAPKSGTHPIAYSAKGTHASYPRPGRYRFKFVDRASKGAEWRTWENVRFVDAEPWRGYGGGWGDVGPGRHATGPEGPHVNRSVDSVREAAPCDFGSKVGEKFLGDWKSVGPVHQPSSPTTYHAELTLFGGDKGEQVGTSFYPGLDCGGTLELRTASQSEIVVTERITEDPRDTCVKKDTIRLTLDGERWPTRSPRARVRRRRPCSGSTERDPPCRTPAAD